MKRSHRRSISFSFPFTAAVPICIFLSSLMFMQALSSEALAEIPPFNASEHSEFSEALGKLKTIAIMEKDGARTFGSAKLERRDYIRLLHLKGEPFELGYQHGMLLKNEIINILKNRVKVESFFGLF